MKMNACISAVAAAAVGGVLLMSSGCGSGSGKQIACGGSTFVGPMMQEWAKEYEKAKGVKIDYTLAGSGKGIQQMTQKTYAFGCSDAPMNKEQVDAATEKGGEVIQVPLVMGAVVVAYNLKDVKEPIKFTGEVLADIYLGKIKKWNDPALKALNKGLALPDADIKVVHRSEPSGTSNIFTNYLSKVSKDWKTKVGSNFDVKWPIGDGAKGTDGVTTQISQTQGAIGYIEILYAINAKDKMSYGTVRNKAGKDVMPTAESVTAAADKTEIPDDLQFMLTDADGEESYPICGSVYAVLYKKQPSDQGNSVVDFLKWATGEGQKFAPGQHYAPLPKALADKVAKKLDEVEIGK